MSGKWSGNLSDPSLRILVPKISLVSRGVAILGIALFISGIFIPSVRMSSSGATMPLSSVSPLNAGVYGILAVVALVLILADYNLVPALIGTTLGLYLIILGVPGLLQGLLGPGFTIMVIGDMLLIAGCLYPQMVCYGHAPEGARNQRSRMQ